MGAEAAEHVPVGQRAAAGPAPGGAVPHGVPALAARGRDRRCVAVAAAGHPNRHCIGPGLTRAVHRAVRMGRCIRWRAFARAHHCHLSPAPSLPFLGVYRYAFGDKTMVCYLPLNNVSNPYHPLQFSPGAFSSQEDPALGGGVQPPSTCFPASSQAANPRGGVC